MTGSSLLRRAGKVTFIEKRLGDKDDTVGVVGIRPTGDQGQPLIGKVTDPFTILALLLSGDVFVREDKLFFHRIPVRYLSHIEDDLVIGFKVNDVAKHLAFDVVMPGDDSVADVARIG
jgi:hypothetical protein